MKELIEKLEYVRDYTKGRTQSINVALKFKEIEFLLQALTSVNNESAEENYGEKMRNMVRKAKLNK